jgi:hypothetical protein
VSSAAPQGRRVRLPKVRPAGSYKPTPVASAASLVLALSARLPVLVQSAHSLPYHRCPVASRVVEEEIPPLDQEDVLLPCLAFLVTLGCRMCTGVRGSCRSRRSSRGGRCRRNRGALGPPVGFELGARNWGLGLRATDISPHTAKKNQKT